MVSILKPRLGCYQLAALVAHKRLMLPDGPSLRELSHVHLERAVRLRSAAPGGCAGKEWD